MLVKSRQSMKEGRMKRTRDYWSLNAILNARMHKTVSHMVAMVRVTSEK